MALSVVVQDSQLRRNYTHLTSMKEQHTNNSDLEQITPGHVPGSQFILDARMDRELSLF